MSIVDRLREALAGAEAKALETRLIDLEIRCTQLYDENVRLREQNEVGVSTLVADGKQRILDLEAALRAMLKMFGNAWSGADEQAVMRACVAVLEAKKNGTARNLPNGRNTK